MQIPPRNLLVKIMGTTVSESDSCMGLDTSLWLNVFPALSPTCLCVYTLPIFFSSQAPAAQEGGAKAEVFSNSFCIT